MFRETKKHFYHACTGFKLHLKSKTIKSRGTVYLRIERIRSCRFRVRSMGSKASIPIPVLPQTSFVIAGRKLDCSDQHILMMVYKMPG